MLEHNVGMWCEGENPLFVDRLSTMNQTDSQLLAEGMSESSLEENPLNTDGPSETEKAFMNSASSPAVGMAKKAESSQSHNAHSPNSSPEPKRPRLSSAEEALAAGNRAEVCVGSTDDTSLPTGMEKVHHTPCASLDQPPSHPTESETADGVKTAANSERTACDGGDEVQKVLGTEQNAEGAAQKGFDPKRWVVDPLCGSCRLKYIDPKPWDLLLYLHAHKYKVKNPM